MLLYAGFCSFLKSCCSNSDCLQGMLLASKAAMIPLQPALTRKQPSIAPQSLPCMVHGMHQHRKIAGRISCKHNATNCFTNAMPAAGLQRTAPHTTTLLKCAQCACLTPSCTAAVHLHHMSRLIWRLSMLQHLAPCNAGAAGASSNTVDASQAPQAYPSFQAAPALVGLVLEP